MTSKERFLTTLEHAEPDRVPVFANLTPQVGERLGKELGVPEAPVMSRMSQRVSHNEVLIQLGNDAVAIRPTWPKHVQERWQRNVLVDDFGFEYTRIGYYAEVAKRPLAHVQTIADVEAFQTPDPLLPETWKYVEEQISRYGENYAIIGDLEASIFELSWNLVGLEKFVVDLISDQPYVPALLDKILDYSCAIGKRMVELGADVIWAGDDFGTQNGMMVSPELWRRYFKPRMKRLFSTLKAVNRDVRIAYHSCGSILLIIPDLIEIGLEILNPIQPTAKDMDLGELKKTYGEKLAFFGGVDMQNVLPFGSVEEVEEEVRLRIRQAGEGGGFVIAPAHNIQPDTPSKNIYAFFDAVKKHGRYPLGVDSP
jgi:uroporphyrinogen decarboxylase